MRTVILGLDAFDPMLVEELHNQGLLPNLGHYIQQEQYARFMVVDPPQSEVSWTSIATGLDPGGHGMFDFVHRNPANYRLSVSLLPTKERPFLGRQFMPPFNARTIFDQAVSDGYPATALWWPATFPARPESPVRTIPGLGTPDIHGRLGAGTLFSSQVDLPEKVGKTRAIRLERLSASHYQGCIPGPLRRLNQETNLPLELILNNPEQVHCHIGKQGFDLVLGQWSPILELSFKTGLLYSARVLTRLILTETSPEVKLYALPLQLHPLHSPWHYAAPRPFIKQTWQQHGPFLTLGWPQDTNGLEDGCLNDQQFLALCDTIFATRQRIFLDQVARFQEGILAAVFDSLDRIQHMFWQNRPEVVRAWYIKLDDLVGRVQKRLTAGGRHDARLIIVSDHGFTNFDYKVNLNRWLIERGYLKPDGEPEGDLKSVDWSHTQAYALGLNSLYLNRQGREVQGIVTAEDVADLNRRITGELLAWRGPDGRPVIEQVLRQSEAFHGPLAIHGPDLLMGYAPGYRASAETGLGFRPAEAVVANRDHWNGDHCMHAAAVPGVIFASSGLQDFPQPSFADFPYLALGKTVDPGPVEPLALNDEEQAIVEERLKDLGYL
jgi:predicted AlkP superfamily phosphohydrolase/phosphomutase